MLENLLKSVFGSRHERELRRTRPLVEQINRFFTDNSQICAHSPNLE